MNYWHIFFNCDGEVEPSDRDDDGIIDSEDNCPDVANADQANNDGDTLGDACDNCPDVTNEDQANYDGDELGDACDPDDDNDGIDDVDENAGCEFNPDTTCGETGGVDPCIPDAPDGCTQAAVVKIQSQSMFFIEDDYAVISINKIEAGVLEVTIAPKVPNVVKDAQIYIPSLEIIKCVSDPTLVQDLVIIEVTGDFAADAEFEIEVIVNYCQV